MFTAKCWKYRDWHKEAVDFTAFVATTAAIIPKPAADVQSSSYATRFCPRSKQ
jgi:hypothetical protein